MRRLLARRHIRAVIPRRRGQRPGDGRQAPVDRQAYRERDRVERLVNRLTQHRCRRRLLVATRSEQRALDDVATLTLASRLRRR